MITYETQYNAPAMMYGRSGQDVTGIVIHHYGVMGSTYAGTIRTLTKPTAAASAHFVIDAGKVAQLVALSDTAYHADNWPINLCTIGVECPPEALPEQIETLVQLIAGLYKVYGRVLPLTGHKDHAKTACPGRYYPLLADIQARATELWTCASAPDPQQPKPTPDNLPDWAQDAAGWATSAGLVAGDGQRYGWDEPVTLARAVTILHRYHQLTSKKE